MRIMRRKTKVVKIGNVLIGANNPIAIQSMAKTKTSDIRQTLSQIKKLEAAGCQIIRVAVKDTSDAKAIKKIRQGINMPLVADIHFDWRLALEAIDSGADKIRLNPGNIYKKHQIKEIVRAAKSARIPIRVGLNSGSLRSKGGKRTIETMVKSCQDYIKLLEGFGFFDIVVSLKSSHILDTIEAYRKMARICDYPFHLGVTATGLPEQGMTKSSIAIGSLLLEGIGDTIRISLTDSPVKEVKAAQDILEALNLANFGPQIISCPTCGRCEVDLVKIVRDLEKKLSVTGSKLQVPSWRLATQPLKVAVMGCVVNGPGEAKQADLGIAFGQKQGLLFKKGKPIRKVLARQCVDVLLKEIKKL
jgi:(E)-4-hydroxy-3-methylbut-2-enyl-diphosphate synthase